MPHPHISGDVLYESRCNVPLSHTDDNPVSFLTENTKVTCQFPTLFTEQYIYSFNHFLPLFQVDPSTYPLDLKSQSPVSLGTIFPSIGSLSSIKTFSDQVLLITSPHIKVIVLLFNTTFVLWIKFCTQKGTLKS